MNPIVTVLLSHFLLSGMAFAIPSEYHQERTDFQDTIQIGIAENINLFDADEPLDITFIFNMRDFMRGIREGDYVDAVMTLHWSENDSITQNLRIRARGNYRRSVCAFPPIMINPRKEDSASQILSDNRNIKLVTHCRNRNYFENYVLKEYLVYKLYNQVTDYSFKVRLAKINYVDAADPDDVISRYGFLIENIDNMAERNNAIVLNNESLKQEDMIPVMMTRLALFAYMIGNFDWQLAKPHNIEIIKSMDILTPRAIPVPYDFDFSGLVDAPYAEPRKDLGMKSIQQRVYLGICSHQDEWTGVLNELTNLREDFYNLIDKFRLLDSRSKRQIISYLDEFYAMIRDRDTFLYRMRSECRQETNIVIIK
ncbi:MAG: hypothetical protein JXB19_00510 [Bacteroidales bacterium]|nr:hypothetical protein [Bacteroidales bacterium]